MVAVMVFATVLQAFRFDNAYAAQFINRSLTLQANGANGGSAPGVAVNHKFDFQIPAASGTTSVGSILFEYCTNAAGTCTTPTGLVTNSGVTLSAQSGATGFTLGATNVTNGRPYITRTAANIVAPTTVSYTLSGVTNPTATNTSFYVRISTFTTTNPNTGTPTALDSGTVAASTANPIQLSGIMPESLIFCTGATVTVNCGSATAGAITFSSLFSPSATATATSQMAASTNAGSGYVITVNGSTMTSGSNTIPALASAATASSTVGSGAFGLNLRANTTSTSTPAAGADLTVASNGTDKKGQALTGYNTADTFKFVSGDSVANSAYDGTTNTTLGPTNSQVYTATYIVNVSGIQTAGTYTTTLTYICTPTF